MIGKIIKIKTEIGYYASEYNGGYGIILGKDINPANGTLYTILTMKDLKIKIWLYRNEFKIIGGQK